MAVAVAVARSATAVAVAVAVAAERRMTVAVAVAARMAAAAAAVRPVAMRPDAAAVRPSMVAAGRRPAAADTWAVDRGTRMAGAGSPGKLPAAGSHTVGGAGSRAARCHTAAADHWAAAASLAWAVGASQQREALRRVGFVDTSPPSRP